MALKDIILEIQKLSTFFAKSLASYTASEPVLKEVSERKHEDGLTCSPCHSNNVVRFGKYNVKRGSRTLERQRYRCKDCKKTFTDITNSPLHRTHLPHKWLEFVQCMI